MIMTMPTTESRKKARRYRIEADRNAIEMQRMSFARRSHTKNGPVLR